MVRSFLTRLGELLVAIDHRSLLEVLLPGAQELEIRQAFDARGLTPSEDIVDLYMWSRGSDTTQGLKLGQLWMFPGFYLLCLDDALANYDAFLPNGRWSRWWFPVFADGGGDFYFIELEPGMAWNGAIRRFRIEYDEQPVEFASLADQIKTIVAALETGVIALDSYGRLGADADEYATIAQHLNPTIQWWRE